MSPNLPDNDNQRENKPVNRLGGCKPRVTHARAVSHTRRCMYKDGGTLPFPRVEQRLRAMGKEMRICNYIVHELKWHDYDIIGLDKFKGVLEYMCLYRLTKFCLLSLFLTLFIGTLKESIFSCLFIYTPSIHIYMFIFIYTSSSPSKTLEQFYDSTNYFARVSMTFNYQVIQYIKLLSWANTIGLYTVHA